MITFAIPFEEGTARLERTLASVLAQTTPGWKLLVCDDGVDPLTKPQVESLNDNRVQYFKNRKRLGNQANANQCLDLADTELVTVLGAGDFLLPHYAEHMEGVLASSQNAVVAFCQASEANTEGKLAWSFSGAFRSLFQGRSSGPTALKNERALHFLRKASVASASTACMRKPVLGSYRFSTDTGEPDLWNRLVQAGHTILYTPERAYAVPNKRPRNGEPFSEGRSFPLRVPSPSRPLTSQPSV